MFKGSRVNLFQLQKIKESIGRTEVSYERAEEVAGGLLYIQLDSVINR